jgi:4'-phosphopantetheinyl transferase EntD
MLTLILPEATSFATQLADDPKLAELASKLGITSLPQRCAPARAREFLAGRVAAHRALAALNAPNCSVARQARAPVWPTGFVGSISHSAGLAVALCASSQHYLALGIDIQTPIEVSAWPALQRFAMSIDEWTTCKLNPQAFADVMSRKEAAWKCCAALGFNLPLPSLPAHAPLSKILPNAVLTTQRCGDFSVSIAMLSAHQVVS